MATFLGVDVSYAQGTINWSSLAAAKSFAFIKASGGDGGLYTDSYYSTNRSGAEANSMPRGYYHFGSNGQENAIVEANYFSAVVGSLNTGDVLVLDTETTYTGYAPDPTWCLDFLNQVSSNYGGYLPLIYMNYNETTINTWSALVNAGYSLWLADYTGSPNFGLSPAWWGNTYNFHQYTSTGTVSGISGNVDHDAFNATTSGTIADFGNNYGYQGSGPPPVSITYPTSQTSSTSFTQSIPQTIIVPNNNYDQVVYSTSFTYTASGFTAPDNIDTTIDVVTYPVGIYNIDGSGWADIGTGIPQGSYFTYIGGIGTPSVTLTVSASSSGVISFTSTVNDSFTHNVEVRFALIASPLGGTVTNSSLTQNQAYGTANIISNYNAYRRIYTDEIETAHAGSTVLTAIPHGQNTIPVPLLMTLGSSDTDASIYPNQFSSTGFGGGTKTVLLDNTNLYIGQSSSNSFYYGYRIYKDN